MFRILAIAIIVISIFYGKINAGENSATLDSLINLALENNPQIQASSGMYEASRYSYKAEGWLPDPELSVALSNVPYSSLALDETPMSGIALGFTQKIPWPGEIAAKKGIAGQIAETKRYSLSETTNRVVRSVKSSYYNYSFWDLAGIIIDDNITLLNALVEVANTKYANGSGLAADVLKAQTELAKMENRKLEFTRMRKLALAEINSLVNRPAFETAWLVSYLPPVKSDLPDNNSVLANAENANPSLGMAKANMNLAVKEKSLASSSYWPDIMLGVEYRIRENVPMDAVRGEDFLSAKIGLSLPLWFWHNQKNKVQAAKSKVIASEDNYQNATRQLEYRVSSVMWELERLRDSYELYENSIIPQAKSSLESSQIAYQVGKVDFLNLLTAWRTLFELNIEKLKIQRDYNINQALLDELIGKN